MKEFLFLLAGAIGGFFANSTAMKMSFKQRTIDNKIKVYDALIVQWVKMRNFIYTHSSFDPNVAIAREVIHQFDQMYGESQQFIGEAFLVCEDDDLNREINAVNEKLYRTAWDQLPLANANEVMEEFKKEALSVISRMRADIKASTRFECHDFVHIAFGFFRKKKAKT